MVITGIAFVLRIPAVKMSVRHPMANKEAAVMAVMVPKGLAAVVLASIPVQLGIEGGQTIQSVTYGVVLFSIVGTSILVLLLEKTPLPWLYGWMMGTSPAAGVAKQGFRSEKVTVKTPQIRSAGDRLFGGGNDEDTGPEG